MAAPFNREFYAVLEGYFDSGIPSDGIEDLQPWLQVDNKLELNNCRVVFDWGIEAIVSLVLTRVHGQIVLSINDHTGYTIKQLSIESTAVIDESVSYGATLERPEHANSDELGAVILLEDLARKLSKRS